MANSYDVVVIGGGPAGLSGALTLARARRSVVVVDAGRARNARAAAVHDFLTRDGCAPADLISSGRAEIAHYGVHVVDREVLSVRRDGSTFVVALDGGSVRGRKLLVASGLVDHLPDIEGLAQLWGTDVLYCPYCHGWEVKDQPIGVLATNAESVHQALMFRQWSPWLTFFLNGTTDPSQPERAQLDARQITVVAAEVTAVSRRGDRLDVELSDGTRVQVAALALVPRMAAHIGFLDSLGLCVITHPSGLGTQVQTDASGRTNIAGVYAAGNVADISAHVVNAASSGLLAAMAMNSDLVEEDTQWALTARGRGGHGQD